MNELRDRPYELDDIMFNLFYAIKLVAAKVLLQIPISGNVLNCSNGTLSTDQTQPIDIEETPATSVNDEMGSQKILKTQSQDNIHVPASQSSILDLNENFDKDNSIMDHSQQN